MEKIAKISRYPDFKHVDYTISDLIECMSGPLISDILEVDSLTNTILNNVELRQKETNGITVVGLIKSVHISINRMQYMIDMITLNIETICPMLVTGLPTLNRIGSDENSDASVLMTWYQPNETEEMFMYDQEEFEINEEKDIEYSTAKRSVNIPSTTIALVFLSKIIAEFKQELNTFIEQKGSKTRTLKKIIYIQSMIKNFDELLYYSIRCPEDLLCYFPLHCAKWGRLHDYYELMELATEKEVDESYANFTHMIVWGNSAISKGAEESNKLLGYIKTSLYGGFYYLNEKSSKDQYNYFFANPKLEIATTLFNLLEKEFVTSMYNMSMPDIKVHKVIYIPKLETRFHKALKGTLNWEDEEYKNEIDELPPLNTSFHMKNDIYDSDTHVKVRVLCDREIPVFSDDNEVKKFEMNEIGPHTLYNSIFAKTEDCTSHEYDEDEAIIHVHGGGFISMSSNSHQIYSRILTRDTKIPIFSVDYRLSPKSKFPDALEDLWNVYSWVTKYGMINLGIPCKKITLIGDSAGGNLIASLTNLIIKNDYPVPHKLILAYPALSLQKSSVMPSIYYSMNDPVLNSSFLRLWLKSYLDLEKHDPETDWLISPMLAPESILKSYPQTYLMVGTKDPLRDLSYAFLEKLVKLNKRVKLIEFLHFPHAFLNYDTPFGGVKNAGKTVECLVKWIKQGN